MCHEDALVEEGKDDGAVEGVEKAGWNVEITGRDQGVEI